MAYLASSAKSAFGAEDDDRDQELIDKRDLKEVTLQKRMELREIFDHFAPDGKLKRQAFYDMVSDVMNHDERLAFFAKYVKRARMQKNLEVTKIGLTEGIYTADWDCFVEMVLPRGYELPPMPDPMLHQTKSDEELWSRYYTRGAPKVAATD